MGRIAFWGLGLLVLDWAGVGAEDFYSYWGDGRAEISSYKVIQPRYGELRQGHGVMVFVTEDINRKTLIKVESPTPDEDKIYVLKLNNVLKFTTGIYPYSVMTSVFSRPSGGASPFSLAKLTFSSQEWCGHVFEEVQVRDGQLKGSINSYFEQEGRQEYALELGPDFFSEDNLLVQIRELNGPILAVGQEKEIRLLPALWNLRIAHAPHVLTGARLRKVQLTTVLHKGQGLEAVEWRWTLDNGQRKTVWVEKDYPRRILAWEDSQGGKGELLESLREPYWSLHSNADEVYRQKLRLP